MTALATLALLALTAAPAGPEAAAAPPETPAQLGARLAAHQFPRARWRLGEARTADFTSDGQPDLALLGVDAGAFVLVVVEGPVSEQSRVHALRLPAGLDAAGALCGPAAEVQANVERPDASRVPGLDARARAWIEDGADAGGLGLVLVNASATRYCEAVHVLYDGARLAWWRAPAGPP
jgi:hypothetical protein